MITTATFVGYEPSGGGRYSVKLRITDVTDGVTTVNDETFQLSGKTAAELRDDASRQIAARNEAKAMRDVLAGIAPGLNIPVTAPVAPAPTSPTAIELWSRKNAVARALVALGTIPVGALATRRTALLQEIRDEYEAANAATRTAAEALL